MKHLTQNQIEFLLEYFFKNEKFAGWKIIATKLIVDGECIVGGKERLWSGGVGNFIKMENFDGGFNLTKHIFDVNYFMSSMFFKETHTQYLNQLFVEKQGIVQKYNDILNIDTDV